MPSVMVCSIPALAVGLLRAAHLGALICLVSAGPLTGCTHPSNHQSEVVVHPSTMVPFEDLFVFEDTLVLDPSVILGRIFFMEADSAGSVLVTDMSSYLAHLFAPTGQHLASYSMETCLPSDFGRRLWTSRFADDDRVVLTTLDGAVVVFDRSGNCLAAKHMEPTILSFCTIGDSIYTFRGPRRMSMSIMDVYSMDLESAREINLDHPEFYRLNQNHQGIAGRDLDCFRDGPWYKYHEDMDARPVYGKTRLVQARPEFFVKRDKDIPAELGILERMPVLKAFPLLSGLHALDDDTRVGVFIEISDEYRLENVSRIDTWGLSIVSNSGKFRSVSTIPYKPPRTAAHGYLYFLGDNVPMDDGDVGNRAVIRYRFKPPEGSDN